MTKFEWKIRTVGENDGYLMAGTTVFVAANPGETYQNVGRLVLSPEEAADLERRIKESDEPKAPDLTGEEYNQLMNHLLSNGTREGILLSEILRSKFGASARRRREAAK